MYEVICKVVLLTLCCITNYPKTKQLKTKNISLLHSEGQESRSGLARFSDLGIKSLQSSHWLAYSLLSA